MPLGLSCLSLILTVLYLTSDSALGQIPPTYSYGYNTYLSVQFVSSEYYISEDGGSATITVSLSTAASQTVTVDYSTSDNTATSPTDYQATSGTLTFSPGQTSASFQVIVNNSGFSQDLTLELSLSNPTGGSSLGIPCVSELTIVPPNAIPTVQFEYSQFYVGEDDANATITVTLSEATSQIVTVAYNTSDGTGTAPTDYLSTSGTLTFNADQTSASFPVTINNAGFSQNLTVNLTLSNPTGATTLGNPSAAVLTIVPPDTTCPND